MSEKCKRKYCHNKGDNLFCSDFCEKITGSRPIDIINTFQDIILTYRVYGVKQEELFNKQFIQMLPRDTIGDIIQHLFRQGVIEPHEASRIWSRYNGEDVKISRLEKILRKTRLI